MNTAGWEEICTFTKYRNGKLRDTFRIYTNELDWCKGHSDKTGKDFYFESQSSLNKKLEGLQKIRYSLASGELPKRIVSRYAAFTEEI
jgi:hypothetical protein